jgi:hypothetical protein
MRTSTSWNPQDLSRPVMGLFHLHSNTGIDRKSFKNVTYCEYLENTAVRITLTWESRVE